ncbi:MAG: hypothetical protein GY764_09965 [Halieaceae bacterium]|nr:hypothetical protein [Halieaceae bacterium]
MVRENTDDRGKDTPVATDGWGVVSRLSIYISSVRSEVEEELHHATDPMILACDSEKLTLLLQIQRFLYDELLNVRQATINQLQKDLDNESK